MNDDEIKKIINEINVDNDGFISKEEIKKDMINLGYSPEDVERLAEKLINSEDGNKDGKFSIEEFEKYLRR